ncbi:uncharacterized protein LOC129761543 [Toxorhynchites rutilus septentrionalis]|uniref:uncharacterized protein LOC129761543 n=1 Tax=Toxorhynchites rutilus septentrionalis TaxID=329112 RepID=UPI002478CBDF|nr:uncharacterized protein LOC129761543 [Toxorhynchites rutilus septentrionalis]
MLAQYLAISALFWPALSTAIVADNGQNSAALVEASVMILLKAFQDPFASSLLSQAATSLEADQLQADLMNDVLVRLGGLIVVRFNAASREMLRRPWVHNVLFVDSYEAFRRLHRDLRVEKYDFSGRYLVVYSGEVNETVVKKIFDDLWTLEIINVVLVGDGVDGVKLWTYVPYSTASCRSVNLVRMPNVEDVVQFYPDKTSNFHGCEFRVGSFETRPYTIMDRSSGARIKMSGFEGDLLDVLKERLNFDATIYEPPNGEQWGYALKQNSTGMMRMIQEEEVDFGISCLGISVARNEILKPGIAHYTTALVLAIPKGRPLTAFEKLFRPFTAIIWWMITTMVVGAVIVISMIECKPVSVRDFVYGRGIRTPYLNLIQVFLGVGMHVLPTRNFSRTLLFLWIYFCLVLRTLYQGSMFKYLQQNANLPPSRTLAEIDQTDAYFYVVESAERYYESFPHRYRRVRHLPQEKDNIIHRLEWMINHPESPDVVQGGLDHIAHHNHLYRKKGGAVDICTEFISTYTITIYYPKKSMLTREFDEQILKIQASGLMFLWINRYGDYNFFGAQDEKSSPRQLSNEHLLVGYEICAVMLTFSGIVFALENVSRRFVRLRNLFEYLK